MNVGIFRSLKHCGEGGVQGFCKADVINQLSTDLSQLGWLIYTPTPQLLEQICT